MASPATLLWSAILFAGLAGSGAQLDAQYPARCSESFCANSTAVCPELPPKCDAAREDFFGWATSSTGACNCCPYCIAYLGLDEICAVGQATGIVPTHICGPGLYCYMDRTSGAARCVTMVDAVAKYEESLTGSDPDPMPEFDMKCTKAQLEYDRRVASGTAGNLETRPECDGSGRHAPVKCVAGEICYCQDERGERIFGEVPYSPIATRTMRCACARHNAEAARRLGAAASAWSRMRCLPDGSFDPIQCLAEGCLCVDRADGVPTYADQRLVNATDIGPHRIACFDESVHRERDYYNACEDLFKRNYEDDLRFKLDGYDLYGSTYAKCQMDGNYARVQSNDREVFCADPDGVKIENYALPHGSPAIAAMTCNCARANLLISGVEAPECDSRGNYARLQCRRGECRCVDADGNQIEKEVPAEAAETLSCHPKQPR